MTLQQALQRALTGEPLTVDEALSLSENTANTLDALCEAADQIRQKHCGDTIHTCSIVNARSGRCSEDCHWCAQSAHHSTGVREYEYISEKEMLDAYSENLAHGVQRFSLVTSGRKVPAGHMAAFCSLFRKAGAAGSMHLCASMGLLSKDQLQQLRDAGVTRYHCNLEAAASYFPSLCSTHTQADKLETIRAAREVGMQVCCGGIIGMGENMRQRLELAEEAREAGAVSIPVNILNPIPGTPLENTPLLSEEEIVRSVALMRFVAPKCTLFFAGGRARLSQETMRRMLRGGINGALVGNMLTTVGNNMDQDMEMFAETGYSI
jgi:biotin synthase